LGKYGTPAREIPDFAWDIRESGYQEKFLQITENQVVEGLLVRMLMCSKDRIETPDMISLSYSKDGEHYSLVQTKACPVFPNTRHDAYTDCILFDDLEGRIPEGVSHIKVSWYSDGRTAVDRLVLNP
jgi:hypothetical protein